MTKKQRYFIGLLGTILLFSIAVFRADLFQFTGRPKINWFFENYGIHYLISLSFLIFGLFATKIFNLKAYVGILALVLIEIFYISFLYLSPKVLSTDSKSKGWFSHFRGISLDQRSMIQFEKTCSKYDNELFYTLKPGVGEFSSHEFKNIYEINSIGLRDDEKSLINPEVVFMGDSFTLGWGNDKENIFPDIFEKSTKKNCLNMGISSYGTARESVILNRVNLDSTKLIILQYHDTDLKENNYYVEKKKLGNRTEDEFILQVEYNEVLKRYFPFKYLKYAILQLLKPKDLVGDIKNLGSEYQKYPNYCSEFYNIISQVQQKYNGPIVFTYMGSFFTESKVVSIFENYALKNNIKNVYFLNLGPKLSKSDYYYYDDHLNAKGHNLVAQELMKLVKEKGILL